MRLDAQTVTGFAVVVVVDGIDQSPPEVPGARVITTDHRGPGAARNAGAITASTPLVLFLGDDMLPGPELVASPSGRPLSGAGGRGRCARLGDLAPGGW